MTPLPPKCPSLNIWSCCSLSQAGSPLPNIPKCYKAQLNAVPFEAVSYAFQDESLP